MKGKFKKHFDLYLIGPRFDYVRYTITNENNNVNTCLLLYFSKLRLLDFMESVHNNSGKIADQTGVKKHTLDSSC